MNALVTSAALALISSVLFAMRAVAQDSHQDPVQEAIRKFNSHDSAKPNEVSVVLPIEGEPLFPDQKSPVRAPEKPSKPVLVTGKAPDGNELASEIPDAEAKPEQVLAEEPAPAPPPGLAVRVEKLQEGKGNIDPSKVKLMAPFPAKPLSPPPAGWHLEASENAPPLTREVELSPGKKITLKIRPHLLVPDADGVAVFNIPEPGFDASLGYRQNDTVSAMLSKSIRQLDDDSRHLGNAIDNLQQLLVSLPKPEAKSESKPESKPEIKTTPARKR